MENTICPKTGMKAIRETDTFDTFFESSLVFFAILQSSFRQAFFKRRY